jgi:hypothetical protein
MLDTWAHRRGYILKIELTEGNTTVSAEILETPEEEQRRWKHIVCVHR